MKRLSLLFLLPIWVLLGCGDDEAIMLPTECAGASNFVVDFRPRVWLSENRIWLTDKDEKTEVGESLTVDGIILSFLSFNGACENTYNFNYGYARPATPSSGIVELSVEEVAAVPSGNIIDLASASFNFNLFDIVVAEWDLVVQGCPPVDSVRFLTAASPSVSGDSTPTFEYEYSADDSTLVISSELAFIDATEVLLAIRLRETTEWLGQVINTRLPPPEIISYTDLQPLSLQRTTINWPTGASDLALEARVITNVEQKRNRPLGRMHEGNELSFPQLDNTAGPFLIQAAWKIDNDSWEWSRVFAEWPEEITIDPQMTISAFDFNYPEIRFNNAGAGIIECRGLYLRAGAAASSQRVYYGPIDQGEQLIRLGPLFSGFSAPETEQLFDLGFSEREEFTFSHYLHMDGNYSWYLRNVLSERATGNTWLRTLDYDQLWFRP
ncbi:MAG: hypothetical protein AAFO03_24050 [Bacteroidota bacterium]